MVLLHGIVEMDDAFFFHESSKGEPTLHERRKTRKRGESTACKPVEAKLEPVLTAVAPGGETYAWRCLSRASIPFIVSMKDWTSTDDVIVSEAHPSYRSAAKELHRTHEVPNLRKSEHRRRPWYLITVNNRHSTMKNLLNRHHRGVHTKYLVNYMNLFTRQEIRPDEAVDPYFLRNVLLENNNLIYQNILRLRSVN